MRTAFPERRLSIRRVIRRRLFAWYFMVALACVALNASAGRAQGPTNGMIIFPIGTTYAVGAQYNRLLEHLQRQRVTAELNLSGAASQCLRLHGKEYDIAGALLDPFVSAARGPSLSDPKPILGSPDVMDVEAQDPVRRRLVVAMPEIEQHDVNPLDPTTLLFSASSEEEKAVATEVVYRILNDRLSRKSVGIAAGSVFWANRGGLTYSGLDYTVRGGFYSRTYFNATRFGAGYVVGGNGERRSIPVTIAWIHETPNLPFIRPGRGISYFGGGLGVYELNDRSDGGKRGWVTRAGLFAVAGTQLGGNLFVEGHYTVLLNETENRTSRFSLLIGYRAPIGR